MRNNIAGTLQTGKRLSSGPLHPRKPPPDDAARGLPLRAQSRPLNAANSHIFYTAEFQLIHVIRYAANSSSSAFASFRSLVSKPSVNQS
jgi:hypothetical protein